MALSTELYPGITRSLDVERGGAQFRDSYFSNIKTRACSGIKYTRDIHLWKNGGKKKKRTAETKLETRKQKTRENGADKKIFYAFACTHNAINPVSRIFVIRRPFRP